MIGVNIVPTTTTMRANPLYVEPGDLVSINDVEVELYKEALIGWDEEGNEIIDRTDYNPRGLKFTHARFDEHMQIVWLNKKLIINDEFDHDFTYGPLRSHVYISGKQGGVEYTCAVTIVICKGHEYEHTFATATLTNDGCEYDQCKHCGHIKNYRDIYRIESIKLSKTSYTYNGKAQKPTVTVKDRNGNTIASGNYTVTYSSGRTNAGSYKATVTFKGDYSGSKALTFKINAKKITPTVTLSKTSYVYNGKTQKPTVSVKDGSKKLATSQYTVSYSSGLKNVGKYTVKVTLKGNYSGSKSVTYTIVPKATSISSLTAAKKGFTVKWTKQATQTTGYQIQYSTSSKFTRAKTVTVKGTSTVSKAISSLTGGKKYYVRVRTYKTVSGTSYYSAWSTAKYVTTKK